MTALIPLAEEIKVSIGASGYILIEQGEDQILLTPAQAILLVEELMKCCQEASK
jgi:hypothetical protein